MQTQEQAGAQRTRVLSPLGSWERRWSACAVALRRAQRRRGGPWTPEGIALTVPGLLAPEHSLRPLLCTMWGPGRELFPGARSLAFPSLATAIVGTS